MLEHYERVLPGAADRVFSMAENEQRHRFAWEKRALEGSIWADRMGIVAGLILALAFLAGAVWLISLGRSVEGLAMLGAELAALMVAFIKGRRPDSGS